MFVDIRSCAGTVQSINMWKWINAGTTVIFSTKCFRSTKSASSVRKDQNNTFSYISLIHNYLMKCLSSMVNPIVATALLLTSN